MARPRKPTSVLELTGQFKKHPERKRARKDEPTSNGPLGDPPKSFSSAEKSCWVEILELAHQGVLTKADRWAVEVACRIMAKIRAKDGGIGGRYGASNGEVTQLSNLLGRFGMTPADRSKVGVPGKQEEDNPFAQLAAESTVKSKVVN